MGNAPEGFEYVVTGSGDVRVTHHGRLATTPRGLRVAQFLDEVEAGDPQEVMARVTGNYKRGNERTAKLTHATNGYAASATPATSRLAPGSASPDRQAPERR